MFNPHISVVTPVYNCKECLLELYQRLKKTLEQITSDFEIIMVNDASPDNAWEVIRDIANQDNRVKGINLSRNFGQHYAITAGLDFAKGEWVVVMDCDLQDQPEEIEKLYIKAQEGYDVVLGKRHYRQDGFFKKLGSKIFYLIFSYLTDTEQDGTIANFGIYNSKVIDIVKSMRENLRFFPVMVKWTGFNIISMDIEHAARETGKSSYTFKKMLNLAFDVMIAFSDKPLRLTVKTGLIMSLTSFSYATYIVIRALFGIRAIEGWSSLIVSIWFLSGLTIFILGIIGTYIGKIFDEVKKRPIYVVQEKIND